MYPGGNIASFFGGAEEIIDSGEVGTGRPLVVALWEFFSRHRRVNQLLSHAMAHKHNQVVYEG